MIRGTRAPYRQLAGLGLDMFTNDELAELHRATLDVLEDAGIMVLNDEALEVFYSHGCKVDKKSNIVKIPPYLVEEAIRSAPSKLLLAGRNPKYDIVLEGTRVGFTNFGVGIKVLDMETGKIRESTNEDLAECTILCDAADAVDVVSQPVTPRDTPPAVQDLYATETCLANTSKHFHHLEIFSGESAKRLFQMGVAIAGSEEEMRRRPICSMNVCPVSPMQLSCECCGGIIECAKVGLPCNIITEALSGATAPVTLAGTLLVHNAEVLGCITLSQLTKKGAPVIYASSTTLLDLSCVNAPVGAPELGMISAAVAKLGQYYNLPTYVAGT